MLGKILGIILGDTEGDADGDTDGIGDGWLLGDADGTVEGPPVRLVDSVAKSDAAGREIMLTSVELLSSTQQSRCSPWSVGQQKMRSWAQVGFAEQSRGIPLFSKSRGQPAPRIVPEATTVATAHGSNNTEAFRA